MTTRMLMSPLNSPLEPSAGTPAATESVLRNLEVLG